MLRSSRQIGAMITERGCVGERLDEANERRIERRLLASARRLSRALHEASPDPAATGRHHSPKRKKRPGPKPRAL